MFKKGGCGYFAKLGGKTMGPISIILGYLGTSDSSWYTFNRFTDNQIRIFAGLEPVIEEPPKPEEPVVDDPIGLANLEPQNLSPRSNRSEEEEEAD